LVTPRELSCCVRRNWFDAEVTVKVPLSPRPSAESGAHRDVALLRELRAQVAAAADTRGDVRQQARDVGVRLASEFDEYWVRAVDEGPVDVVDLFSGCGGLSAGFRAFNAIVPVFRLVLAVDTDPVANATYAENLHLEPVQEDVAALAAEPARLRRLVTAARPRGNRPLVVVGGPPCQGFSSHRKGAVDDTRNSLVVRFAEAAASLSPDLIALENVPELLTDRHWPVLEAAVGHLSAAGYTVSISIHNTAEYGVPQERFRALVLATRQPASLPRGYLARADFRTVRDAIGELPAVSAGERTSTDPLHYTARHRESTLEVLRAVPHDGGSRPTDVGPESLRRGYERQGKPMYEDVYGRLAWNRPAVTISTYARNPASGRYAHPEQDRGLSIREAALLQGFPLSWRMYGTLDPCFRQIGNAVPPRFAAFLAAHLIGELLATEPGDPDGPGVVKEPVGVSFSRLIPSLKSGSRRL
jgi:DNA (cytosine-5)-methyltransferase 1